MRKLRIWKYFRDYFPISLIKTTELEPSKNYIFGYHPHGVLCAGAFCNFATEATDFSSVFPRITHICYHSWVRKYRQVIFFMTSSDFSSAFQEMCWGNVHLRTHAPVLLAVTQVLRYTFPGHASVKRQDCNPTQGNYILAAKHCIEYLALPCSVLLQQLRLTSEICKSHLGLGAI